MRIFLALAAGLVALTTSAVAMEQVEIPRGDATLDAASLPAGRARARFPAVVALHGCDGVVNRSAGSLPHFADWGERLAADGVVVLFPDSFGSRGLGVAMPGAEPRVRSSSSASTTRPSPGAGCSSALRHQGPGLAARLVERRNRNAVGGAAKENAARRRCRISARRLPSIRAAAPSVRRTGARGCRRSSWSGREDDWTPAAPCARMVADAPANGSAARRSSSIRVLIMPSTGRIFRCANSRDSTYSADRSGKAHVGTNDAARADALKRVPEWLSR